LHVLTHIIKITYTIIPSQQLKCWLIYRPADAAAVAYTKRHWRIQLTDLIYTNVNQGRHTSSLLGLFQTCYRPLHISSEVLVLRHNFRTWFWVLTAVVSVLMFVL